MCSVAGAVLARIVAVGGMLVRSMRSAADTPSQRSWRAGAAAEGGGVEAELVDD